MAVFISDDGENAIVGYRIELDSTRFARQSIRINTPDAVEGLGIYVGEAEPVDPTTGADRAYLFAGESDTGMPAIVVAENVGPVAYVFILVGDDMESLASYAEKATSRDVLPATLRGYTPYHGDDDGGDNLI